MEKQNSRSNKSNILDVIHETASDLHNIGLINEHTMARYDALCVPPAPDKPTPQFILPRAFNGELL